MDFITEAWIVLGHISYNIYWLVKMNLIRSVTHRVFELSVCVFVCVFVFIMMHMQLSTIRRSGYISHGHSLELTWKILLQCVVYWYNCITESLGFALPTSSLIGQQLKIQRMTDSFTEWQVHGKSHCGKEMFGHWDDGFI